MVATRQERGSFFRDAQQQATDFNGERLLTEVEAQFQSPELLEELHWRLEVLHELAEQHEFTEESEGLRDRLTRIFARRASEDELLEELRQVTTITTKDGRQLDLRHFLMPERQLYNEAQYRRALARKVENTEAHALTLGVYYPQEEAALRHLGKLMRGLGEKLREGSVPAVALKRMEDSIREMPVFQAYEGLKERFLRDWLAEFGGATAQQLAALGEDGVRQLIVEHQRHQATQLVKAGVKLLDSDVSEHLGLHDTLEGEFRAEAFWARANVAVKRGFTEWVLRIVAAAGMVEGRRYALFQSQADPESYLLAGVGLAALPEPGDEPIRMVPYLKPFTRKAGYLLEVRHRSVGELELYHEQLRHYTLPFLFGFDKVRGLEVPRELRAYFNSAV